MLTITQPFVSRCRLLAALPLCAAMALGCQGTVSGTTPTPGSGGAGGTPAGGGGSTGNPGSGGTGVPGSGGAAGAAVPCMGPSDPSLVVASQRVLRLTLTETLNTVRYLIDATEADKLVTDGLLGQKGDDNNPADRLFPPLQEPEIIGAGYTKLDRIAQHVRDYVLANYATLAMASVGCSAVTDMCANMYVDKLAARAYRRPLTPAEKTRVTGLYNKLKSQTMNGYLVTSTVQEAVSNVAYALMSSPQMLWRSEIGNAAMASTAPAGIPLTDAELATHLSFFLTDMPPDDMLVTAAAANTLRTNLTTHVNRLLATQTSKDWLRTVIETYYLINQLPNATIDPGVFPIWGQALMNDMRTDAQKFLDDALWKGNLTDLLLSRKGFPNSALAENIYKIPVPAGATVMNFVETMLPADQRSGILTNAAFIASRGRADGKGLVIPRGKVIASAVLCTPPGPPTGIPMATIEAFAKKFEMQTAQEQVAARKAVEPCASCHAQFDAYGLVMDYYDNLGRYRTLDDLNMPVDGRTNMPAALGGEPIASAIELSQKLAAHPGFTNCMAKTLLQYAMVDFSAPVELPLLPKTAGCAAADVASRFNSGTTKTFSDLVRATAATPAFVLRRADAP